MSLNSLSIQENTVSKASYIIIISPSLTLISTATLCDPQEFLHGIGKPIVIVV